MGTENRNSVMIKKGLWTEHDGGASLIGSRCTGCGEVFFPKKENDFCPHCQNRGMEECLLSNEATIQSYTVVHQLPAGGFYKGPVPYSYGIVRLPDGVNTYTLFTDCDWEQMECGQKARLVIEKLYEQDGQEVLTFKFDPIF